MTDLVGGAAASSDERRRRVRHRVVIAPAIELRGIVKRFPGVVANDGVNLAVARRRDPRHRRARTAPASRR